MCAHRERITISASKFGKAQEAKRMKTLTMLAVGAIFGLYVGILVGCAGARPDLERDYEASDQWADSIEVVR